MTALRIVTGFAKRLSFAKKELGQCRLQQIELIRRRLLCHGIVRAGCVIQSSR